MTNNCVQRLNLEPWPVSSFFIFFWYGFQLEIHAYAKDVLGMNPEEDPDLLYIARDALKAPLPPGWKPWYVLQFDFFQLLSLSFQGSS